MPRGRPRKPEAVKILQGNPGKRRKGAVDRAPLADGLPAASEDVGGRIATLKVPSPPSHLSRAAKEEWQRLAAGLVHLGLLRQLDMGAFEARCELYATFRRCRLVVQKKGLTYTANGVIRTRPEARMMQDCLRQIRAWDSEFGLTPAARARVGHVTGDAAHQPGLPGLSAPAAKTKPAPGQPQPTAQQPIEGMNDDEFFSGPPN